MEPDSSSIPAVEVRNSADGAGASAVFTEEIEALKMKISELESHAKRGSPATTSQNSEAVPRNLPDCEQGITHPNLMADMEQYKRMEECLYKHRKEWEGNGLAKHVSFHEKFDSDRVKLVEENNRGPWMFKWKERSSPAYKRPNPFDPSHQCIDFPNDANDMDEFDRAIDFGAARDRLRKNFEWDIDRLFLAEEMEIRRRRANEAKQSLQEEKVTKEDPKRRASAQLKLNRVDWFAFKRLFRSEESQSCVIDVLIGDPVLDDDFGRSSHPYLGRRVARASKFQHPKTPVSKLAPREAPLPERIRIHSAVLHKILAMIDPGLRGTDPELPSLVLVRPFKALSHYDQALRAWCTVLEQQLELNSKHNEPDSSATQRPGQGCHLGHSSTSSKPDNVCEKPSETLLHAVPAGVKDEVGVGNQHVSQDAGDDAESTDTGEDEEEEKVDPEDLTRSPMALDHLKCLLSFIDSYILARQNYLDSHDCRKVFFPDLWYLFRPGMEVIGRDGKQAYRVVKVTSPRHRVVPAWQTWLWGSGDKKKKALFSLTCVYIDFDGHRIGPVSDRFDFKKFDGETEVTSLPVYPLRLHSMTRNNFSEAEWLSLGSFSPESRYRQKLINRGAKFLEVAGVKSMFYAGPTLGVRDEVESQVVIDFETAFSVDNERQQAWKPNLEIMLGNPDSIEPSSIDDTQEDRDEVLGCRAACCRDDWICNDAHIDDLQRETYVNGLLPKTGGPNERPSVAIVPQPLGELRNHSDKTSYAISNDERVIMSYRVFGFVLRSRQWGNYSRSTFSYLLK